MRRLMTTDQYLGLADRAQEFAHMTSAALLFEIKMEERLPLQLELMRRMDDSRRSERNGRGSCRLTDVDVMGQR